MARAAGVWGRRASSVRARRPWSPHIRSASGHERAGAARALTSVRARAAPPGWCAGSCRGATRPPVGRLGGGGAGGAAAVGDRGAGQRWDGRVGARAAGRWRHPAGARPGGWRARAAPAHVVGPSRDGAGRRRASGRVAAIVAAPASSRRRGGGAGGEAPNVTLLLPSPPGCFAPPRASSSATAVVL